jgi:hypothetical protein
VVLRVCVCAPPHAAPLSLPLPHAASRSSSWLTHTHTLLTPLSPCRHTKSFWRLFKYISGYNVEQQKV